MTNVKEEVLFGMDALDAMQDEDNDGAEFTSLKSGTTMRVKLANMSKEDGTFIPALMAFYSYGIYKKVNSFVAQNPSKKSKKGYPVSDLTPWDKAWKYHADLSEKFQDAQSQAAYLYQPKKRFVIAFIDLDTGLPIFLDFSKKQAETIYPTIKKNEKKWKERAFDISKEGKSTDTKVLLSVIVDLDDEDEGLTDKQRKNFDTANQVLEPSAFNGLLFEVEEEEMIRKLDEAGFDVTLIGLEVPPPREDDDKKEDGGTFSKEEIEEELGDDLPF